MAWLFHGFSLLDELELYEKIGLTPREALYTATVAPGRRADLVLLDANPLEGLKTLRQPRAFVVNGRLLDRSTIDKMARDLGAAGDEKD